MTGRERIIVGAEDTLEGVLARLRVSHATALVLEVDERSPLLSSLPQLHTLDELAQERGIQIAIASTNRKLLNAARVFGLEVIDARLASAPVLPEPGDQLTADQPARADAAPPAEGAGQSDTAWSDGNASLARPLTRAAAPRRLIRRLDPYGQPYDDEATEEETAPHTKTRTIRPLRVGRSRDETTTAIVDDLGDEGWDEDDRGTEDERERGATDDDGRRRGPFGGIAAFWGDVRDWIETRRNVATPDEQDDDDDPAAGPEHSPEEGWDEPPYRTRAAPQRASLALPELADQEQDNQDDDAEAGSSPTSAAEEVGDRRGRSEQHAAPSWDDAGAAAPTAHLRPFIASVRTFNDDDDFEPGYAPAPARRGAMGGGCFTLGGLVGVILALGLVALLVLYIVVPTATVTLVARTGTLPVEFGVLVGEIDPNSPEGQATAERIVVPARRITVPLSASSTKPATGARLEPDVTAGGPVVLINSSTSEAATVARGTTLEGTGGRTYVTLEAITIGPSDPLGAAGFNSVTVKAAAGVRGSGGNAPIGAVRGRLANGVYYTNRDAPIAGGTDKRIPTIAQQDLAAAQAAAEEAVRGKGQGALNGAIPAGSAMMRETNGVGNFRVQFNTREGADGDSVTATVNAEATALVYVPGDVEARGRAEMERRLAAAAKPGEPIVPGSVQIGGPQPTIDVPGQLAFTMTGTARTRAAIGGEAERERLARSLAHQDDDATREALAKVPGVSTATVEYETGPFPQRMPWLASHITVRIADNP